MKRSNILRALGLLALVGAGVAGLVFFRPYVADFVAWVQGLGWWGPLVFGIIYAVTALVVPGSIPSHEATR